jgi:hypothetical protein
MICSRVVQVNQSCAEHGAGTIAAPLTAFLPLLFSCHFPADPAAGFRCDGIRASEQRVICP